MSEFFWSGGHLGWTFFALLVYSGLYILTGDLVWRLVTVRARKRLPLLALCWLLGAVLIVLGLRPWS